MTTHRLIFVIWLAVACSGVQARADSAARLESYDDAAPGARDGTTGVTGSRAGTSDMVAAKFSVAAAKANSPRREAGAGDSTGMPALENAALLWLSLVGIAALSYSRLRND